MDMVLYYGEWERWVVWLADPAPVLLVVCAEDRNMLLKIYLYCGRYFVIKRDISLSSCVRLRNQSIPVINSMGV